MLPVDRKIAIGPNGFMGVVAGVLTEVAFVVVALFAGTQYLLSADENIRRYLYIWLVVTRWVLLNRIWYARTSVLVLVS